LNDTRYNRSLHWIALLTAAATFPLIFMGGLVTSHQAGMSVPDWPNSYGYNMFLFPISKWKGGIFYEHTHRLMGTVVGFLSILLVVWAWRTEKSRTIRWLAGAVLGMVIFQGVLGGLRVVLVKLNLAIVHACVAQAFFCLASFVALYTSKWWTAAPETSPSPQGRRLVWLGVIAVLVIYPQLIAGAVMRHYQAGLAVTDFPLIYGHVLPPTDAHDLQKINAHRAWAALSPDTANATDSAVAEQLSRPVTLAQIWIHAIHRYGAVCVTIAALALAGYALRRRRDAVGLAIPAVLLIVLLVAQVTLGSLVVLLRKPADVTSLHVAVGALTLMTAFILTARAWRLFGSPVGATQGEAATSGPLSDRGLRSLSESPALP
jgi:cytochrome c oxidase assembly protein subunit 15